MKHYDQNGFKAEEAIMQWLRRTGYKVTESSWDEDVKGDIDVWVSGRQFTHPTPVSIKSMATGVVYGTIGFELTSDRTYSGLGWYHTGEATHYLILRDPHFIPAWRKDLLERIPVGYQPKYCWLPKARVQHYVAKKGWTYKRGLTPEVLRRQGGLDTVSGYLKVGEILRKDDIEVLPLDWCAMLGIV